MRVLIEQDNGELVEAREIESVPPAADTLIFFTRVSMRRADLEDIEKRLSEKTGKLTIPPGGELRIDSELFLVLLNGENALHTQSGDWINISRNLLRLIVESASGGQLRGQLIYTERYL